MKEGQKSQSSEQKNETVEVMERKLRNASGKTGSDKELTNLQVFILGCWSLESGLYNKQTVMQLRWTVFSEK